MLFFLARTEYERAACRPRSPPESAGCETGRPLRPVGNGLVYGVWEPGMMQREGGDLFVTVYKVGPAMQWKLVQDDISELRTLAHGEATVMYAGFSADRSKIVTVADDRSLKIWSTVSGDILVEEQGYKAPLPRTQDRASEVCCGKDCAPLDGGVSNKCTTWYPLVLP